MGSSGHFLAADRPTLHTGPHRSFVSAPGYRCGAAPCPVWIGL